MRTLTTLLGNSQRLDGGAMFGNAPRALWSRWMEPDEHNRIPLACRALLVREPGGAVLLEAGIGTFFEPRLRERFGVVEERHVLVDSLAAAGLGHQDIDVVVLSHLHFDHAGGLLAAWAPDSEPALLFPRATFLISRAAWERARCPHPRDRASFTPNLVDLLEQTGRVELIDGDTSSTLGPGWRLHRSHGHTPGMMLAEVEMPAGPVLFAADLVPGTAWLHLPITMGYDRFPEQLVDEKRVILADLAARGGRLVYTHDPRVALSGLRVDSRGRYRPHEPMGKAEEVDR